MQQTKEQISLAYLRAEACQNPEARLVDALATAEKVIENLECMRKSRDTEPHWEKASHSTEVEGESQSSIALGVLAALHRETGRVSLEAFSQGMEIDQREAKKLIDKLIKGEAVVEHRRGRGTFYKPNITEE